MGSMDDVMSMEEESEDEDRSVEEEPMIVPKKKKYPYLSPPAHVCLDDVERLPFVLMEDFAYFADRDNATTAISTCEMAGRRGDFKVTLYTAPPPLVSYLCVHATSFDHTEFAIEPKIIATDSNSGLLLLRVVIGDHPSHVMLTRKREYFVYDARSSTPSLRHLSRRGNLEFNETSLAIVRKCNKRSDHHDSTGFSLRPHGASEEDDHNCSNCDYVVAAQSSGFGYVKTSELCLYHSDTETWSKEPVVAKSYPDHATCKTITIGGDKGTVAWVDLSRNIVFCDVLDKRPKLRYVRLPPESEALEYGHPRSVRDVALVGGLIRFVELKPRVQPDSVGNSQCTYHGWGATMWSIKTSSSSSKDWNTDYQLDSTQIPESLLPKLHVSADTVQPTLSSLQIGLPNLSLQDDGVVYFLTKIDHRDKDHAAWVLTVDMKNKTIHKVGEFGATRTVGLAKAYNATRISKYLRVAAGTKQNPKRAGIPLLRSNSKKHLGNSMVVNLGGA
ncbi:unnamed protein product [Alopecurus aequalis]